MTGLLTILQGDWIERLRELPDNSVHCCVTSPPYFGLRSYLPDGHPLKGRELGSERTFQEYVQHCVAGFAEVKRVLRPEGTLWLNLGDSYHTGDGYKADPSGSRVKQSVVNNGHDAADIKASPVRQKQEGLKPKDLIGIPWRVAFALQTDGWYLRQFMPWVKRNSMPESTQDRPVTSCEMFFLFSKSERYFYDAEAVKLPGSMALLKQIEEGYNGKATKNFAAAGAQNASAVKARIIENRRRSDKQRGHSRRHDGFNDRWDQMEKEEQCSGWRSCRNSDWFFESIGGMLLNEEGMPLALVVNPSGYAGAHFATYPPNLIKPCILAGTSAKGCCPKCGAPWERVLEASEPREKQDYNGKHLNADPSSAGRNILASVKAARANGGEHDNPFPPKRTIGWQPTCECGEAKTVPCTVLDPFGGSGTSGQVALELGRRAILIELNPAYIGIIEKRTNITPGLQLA